MIGYSSKYRSTQAEIMDDFNLQGKEMEILLSDLRKVNKWLGGFKITVNGIQQLLEGIPTNKAIAIVDLGCGDGAQLRECALWAKENKRNISFVGIDANKHILEIAALRSSQFNNIRYEQLDVFSDIKKLPPSDIVLSTLFLHHFSGEQIVALMNTITKTAKLGIVINDLHRSRWAFQLFKLFSNVILKTKIARHDGLVSVARAFKRNELLQLSQHINGAHKIKWKWAFRYQWIIKTI